MQEQVGWSDKAIEGRIANTIFIKKPLAHLIITENFRIVLYKYPNKFWRFMQYLFFGFKYEVLDYDTKDN
jgi:hypothetical protein